jgi:hypothetical protein
VLRVLRWHLRISELASVPPLNLRTCLGAISKSRNLPRCRHQIQILELALVPSPNFRDTISELGTHLGATSESRNSPRCHLQITALASVPSPNFRNATSELRTRLGANSKSRRWHQNRKSKPKRGARNSELT